MIAHAQCRCSQAFIENGASSQIQEVAAQNIMRFRRLKTKTSTGHENVSNKLLKTIPISHYGFLLQTYNVLLIENTSPQHWKLSKMILLPKENSSIISVNPALLLSLSPSMDERQRYSCTRTIGLSRAQTQRKLHSRNF